MRKEIHPVDLDISGTYRHYKGGLYRVICLAHHSETLEDMVVYKPLNGDTGCWVRPASMWNETVTVDGKQICRFVKVEE